MSIPLDQLYHFVQNQCDHDAVIYRFVPHGSRKIQDCKPLQSYHLQQSKTQVICHDQESLNYKDYEQILRCYFINDLKKIPIFTLALKKDFEFQSQNYYQPSVLVNSELNSKDLNWFEKYGMIGAYWFAHAAIARDWFRYAEYDNFQRSSFSSKSFLIYNRAWSGLREYRIKFTELLIENDLVNHCKTNFNPVDQQQHWLSHQFANPRLQPLRNDLDQYFSSTDAQAIASASYCAKDYSDTDLEVVLETVFDDSKWHLTEKIFRPIACGHPFILASTPGSLQYLRQYGFRTFGEYIDESYDSIVDPVERLEAIVNCMNSIARLDQSSRKKLLENLKFICDYNKKLFFSKTFLDKVIAELRHNLNNALIKCQTFEPYHFLPGSFLTRA